MHSESLGNCPVATQEGMFHPVHLRPRCRKADEFGGQKVALRLRLDSCLPVAEAFRPLPRSRFVNGFLFLFGPHYPDSSITGFVTLSRPIR